MAERRAGVSWTGWMALYKCDKPPPGQEALIKKGWFRTVTREWPEVCVLIACQPSQGWHLQSHYNYALLPAKSSYILYKYKYIKYVRFNSMCIIFWIIVEPYFGQINYITFHQGLIINTNKIYSKFSNIDWIWYHV